MLWWITADGLMIAGWRSHACSDTRDKINLCHSLGDPEFSWAGVQVSWTVTEDSCRKMHTHTHVQTYTCTRTYTQEHMHCKRHHTSRSVHACICTSHLVTSPLCTCTVHQYLPWSRTQTNMFTELKDLGTCVHSLQGLSLTCNSPQVSRWFIAKQELQGQYNGVLLANAAFSIVWSVSGACHSDSNSTMMLVGHRQMHNYIYFYSAHTIGEMLMIACMQ